MSSIYDPKRISIALVFAPVVTTGVLVALALFATRYSGSKDLVEVGTMITGIAGGYALFATLFFGMPFVIALNLRQKLSPMVCLAGGVVASVLPMILLLCAQADSTGVTTLQVLPYAVVLFGVPGAFAGIVFWIVAKSARRK
jgi:hypothetical protein